MDKEKNLETVANNNDIVPMEQVTLEDLLQDAQGVQLQFDKIKMPTAGSVAYTVLDPESGEEEPVKTLRGVILCAKPANVYFVDDYTGEAVTPTCVSDNGQFGIDQDGEQHDCKTCEFNQFGSGKSGKGKACQNRMTIYVLLDNESVPRQMSLPASALNKFNALRTQLFVTKRLLASVVVKIGLEKKKSASGIEYSSPTFAIDGNVRDLSEERQQAVHDATALLKATNVL